MIKRTYPILLAILPLLWGLQRNQGEIAFTNAFLSQAGIALLTLAALGFAVYRACARISRREGAFYAALLICAVVFFGELRSHWILFSFAVPLVFALNRWSPQVLEWAGRTLVILILGQLLWVEWHRPKVAGLFQKEVSTGGSLKSSPDVYYLVFDSFGSSSLLESRYGIELQEFKSALSQRGFSSNVAFWSNYPTTLYSLASTLNMDYLTFLPDHSKRYIGGTLASLIGKNRVMKTFQQLGYETVGFESFSGVPLLERNPYLDRRLTCPSFPVLWRKLVRSSLLWPVLERSDWEGGIARANTFCLFDQIGEVGRAERPHFVFGYFWVPHSPHFFAKKRNAPEKERYVDELKWLAEQIPAAIDRILEHSPEAIIVLQSDHGPGKSQIDDSVQDWYGIFNAFRAPEPLKNQFLVQETPVNTFRNVLNFLTESQLPLLQDRVWWVQYESPTQVREVPLSLLEGQDGGLS